MDFRCFGLFPTVSCTDSFFFGFGSPEVGGHVACPATPGLHHIVTTHVPPAMGAADPALEGVPLFAACVVRRALLTSVVMDLILLRLHGVRCVLGNLMQLNNTCGYVAQTSGLDQGRLLDLERCWGTSNVRFRGALMRFYRGLPVFAPASPIGSAGMPGTCVLSLC